MKKIYILISILIISFLSYLIIIILPRDYQISYQIDNYLIKEEYSKSLKYYQYLIEYQDKIYPLITTDKYSSKRRLIDKIHEVSKNETTCLSISIKEQIYPICYKDDKLISFYLVSNEIKNQFSNLIKEYNDNIIDNYENIKIYNLIGNSYYIWNYKGYYYINQNQKQNIKLLQKDDYNNTLAYQINNYLITPNYDNKYFFNELLIINTKKVELSSFKFKEEISYDSYYQGIIGKYLYLIDRKNKIQYKINIKKENIELIGNETKNGLWYNDEWEHISLNKLVAQDHYFQTNKVHHFELIDNNLYYLIDEYKILISNNKIKSIVTIKDDRIYYLVQNILYMYSYNTGEVKLLEYSEWDFNFQNKIFIVE